MTRANRWLLPDGVDEILPPQAKKLETLRREILDLYSTWGYELVITPLIEFLDSLLIVPSDELQLETVKVVDQLSGRTMGVRADITSQVARIDANVLKSNGPSRLCYADSVLRAKPSSKLGSRSPFRIGAELYGHSGNASDIEVISLMIETLDIAGVKDIQLALGHVGIYRSLIEAANLDNDVEKKLFAALQRKSTTELETILSEVDIDSGLSAMLKALPNLSGNIEILSVAENTLKDSPGTTLADIQQLRDISIALQAKYPEQSFYYDLSEIRGYEYHTGIVFAAYSSEFGQSIAKGGRYDDIGADFGRARAATGFDSDLKVLLNLSCKDFPSDEKIYAPAEEDDKLNELIKSLRSEGKKVIRTLNGQTESPQEMGCSSQIVLVNEQWEIKAL